MGYSKTPKVVPLLYIAKAVGCSYDEARYRVKKLKEKGIIETWTTKHPTQFKITYYRVPYHPHNIKKLSPVSTG